VKETGDVLRPRVVDSRINHGLYQWGLMLGREGPGVKRVLSGARVRRVRPNYTPPMDRRPALVLLAVLGAGVFLAGLELMVTAVA
jgi:hypothetical protein